MRLPQRINAEDSAGSSALGLTSAVTSPIWMGILTAFKGFFQHNVQALQKRGPRLKDTIDIVDMCICLVSVFGALVIIVPYFRNRRSRKLRHSLILGLATSDLVSSLIIIATSAYGLGGGDLDSAHRFCDFAGYTFVVAIWTQHLWNLSIAVITYMILVHPLSHFVSSVERHLIWLWPSFWAISLLVNGVGWIVVGFGNAGGYCGFMGPRGGKYFSAVFYFVPRAFVVLVVIILYTHLFFFLRRINLFQRATSGSNSHPASSQVRTVDSGAGQRDAMQDSARAGEESTKKDRAWSYVATFDGTSTSVSTKSKWGRRLLPAWFSRSFDSSERTNSSSTQGKASVVAAPANGAPDITAIEMVDYADVSPKSRPVEIPNMNSSTMRPTVSIAAPNDDNARRPVLLQRPSTARMANLPRSATLPGRPSTAGRTNSSSFLLGKGDGGVNTDEDNDLTLDVWEDAFQPMSARRDVKDFGMTSPPQEHLRHYSLSPVGLDIFRQAKEEKVEQKHVNSSTASNGAAEVEPQSPNYEAMLGQGWTWGMPVGGGSQQPLTKTERGSSSRKSSKYDRLSGRFFRSQPSRRETVGDTSQGSSTDENGVESLGSTLNRQASILLLLYPAVYCLLFSISIIRIIVDISQPESALTRMNDALHSVSRWTIFAQGAIDAIVFQIVERSFRARMKRKRRIATGQEVDKTWWQSLGKKLSGRGEKV